MNVTSERVDGGVDCESRRFFPRILTIVGPLFSVSANARGLLKNSIPKNPQKLDRVRMPYKRFAGVA
jgi:hypothetical protein